MMPEQSGIVVSWLNTPQGGRGFLRLSTGEEIYFQGSNGCHLVVSRSGVILGIGRLRDPEKGEIICFQHGRDAQQRPKAVNWYPADEMKKAQAAFAALPSEDTLLTRQVLQSLTRAFDSIESSLRCDNVVAARRIFDNEVSQFAKQLRELIRRSANDVAKETSQEVGSMDAWLAGRIETAELHMKARETHIAQQNLRKAKELQARFAANIKTGNAGAARRVLDDLYTVPVRLGLGLHLGTARAVEIFFQKSHQQLLSTEQLAAARKSAKKVRKAVGQHR